MSNYTKTTDFEAKDSLPSGDSGKIIRGSEFETEFDNIATAIATKADAASPTFTGTVTIDGLTVNGNTTLGNAATDTVTVTADIASNLIPSADDTYDLGASGAEWNDLYIDGTANIDSLVADTADIDGGTIDGVTIGGSSAGAITGTTITGTGFVTSGNMTFGDNDKAIFGADSDLQIYHNGTDSIIDDNGTGSLKLQTGASTKLEVTSTGIDVTGTVTADGLTVDGSATINSAAPVLSLTETDATDLNTLIENSSGNLNISTRSDDGGTKTKRIRVAHSTGDVSFYEDTGTTAKLFWDASAESLGIGTTSPSRTLHIKDAVAGVRLEDSDDNSYGEILYNTGSNGLLIRSDEGNADAGSNIIFEVDGTESARIDSSGNVGIGTSSPVAASGYGNLTLNGNSGGQVHFTDNDVLKATIASAVNDLYVQSGSQTIFRNGGFTSGDEAMRIDSSGNVGINTTSPNYLLDVEGSGALFRINATSGDATAQLSVADTTSLNTINFGDLGSTTSGQILYRHNGDSMAFNVAGAEAVRILNGGNVGIGTSSPSTPLHIQGSDTASSEQLLSLVNGGGAADAGARLWLSGTNATTRGTYIEGQARSTGNNHDLIFATSATSASPTERMRIDFNGNVGIGTGSPRSGYKLDVQESANNGVNIQAGASSSDIALSVGSASTADKFVVEAGGDVGIGTNSPAAKLEVALGAEGEYLRIGGDDVSNTRGLAFTSSTSTSTGALHTIDAKSGNGIIALATGGTEAMRIDSSGNVLVGGTSTTPWSNGTGTASDNQLVAREDGVLGASAYKATASVGYVGYFNRTSTDGGILAFNKDGSTVGSISVTSSTTTYNTSSDQRLKDNIVDAPSASDDIDAIQVRSFDWKADGSHQKYGMVAQELQDVAPEAVTGNADSEDMMGVDYSKLVPMLVKEIQSLRARVAQLEGEN